MDDGKRPALCAETFDMALALSEDLKHMRNLLARDDLSRGDARRLSALLRRILVDGDLRKVAAPRVGRIAISAPQLRDYHNASQRMPIEIFFGGILEFASKTVGNVTVSRDHIGYTYETTDLNVDHFCQQRVICFRGHWVTRQQVIQYIANKLGGVHSDKPSEPSHRLLDELRGYADFRIEGGSGQMRLNMGFAAKPPQPWEFGKDRLDLALVQLLSTSQYLVRSTQVRELEAAIDLEDSP